ncbi:MAG: 2-C-methyl-D-erythritol 4-phosphate cytidylyltransferase [Opitutae bacterium]|jgi:2-C-methyl-D-erythritol 4-phosphate cytidylyltransferase|nr:2-C-methyl-D-erythritol 4-phosphate cytidylyltransferase [Opitutae bacterium]
MHLSHQPSVNSSATASAIILAAGSGSRMQDTVADKTLAPLNGLPVLCHSIRAFLASGCIDRFTIVYRDAAQKAELEDALSQIDLQGTPLDWGLGGDERQDSVYNALSIQPDTCTHVFIHDSARPLVSTDSIQALHTAVLRDHAAVLAHPVTDTIKRIPTAEQLTQTELEDLDRSRLWSMETPQAFALPDILKAYQHVHDSGLRITDDTAAAATIGLTTTIVASHAPNPKITTPADLSYADWLLQQRLP